MSRPLAGRVALVTGSTGAGIGRSTALALARDGADLVLNHGSARRGPRQQAAARRVARAVQALGVDALVVPADTRRPQDIDRLVDRALRRFGRIDILVNNAGWSWSDQDLAEIPSRLWRDTFDAEVLGAAHLIARVLPAMRRRRWGRIVNVALDVAVMDLLINHLYGHVLERYPYPMVLAKRARAGLAELGAYAEYRHGITINTIEPGVIEEMDLDEAVHAEPGRAPRRRTHATPGDVAAAISWLCRDESRFITKSVVRLPGNLYSRLHS